jgi:Flp pilus assembly protein TadB
VGLLVFIALISASVLIYFQNDKFDEKYKKNIEIIRAIKTQKLKDFGMSYFKGESKRIENENKDFPTAENFKELSAKAMLANKNLSRLTKKAADVKMWFDYLPRAKEFLVNAALWTFLLGLVVLVFCLSIWAELNRVGTVQFAGYLSFLWILMGINLFKNILRYNIVTKNINKHMDMLRAGEVEKF